VQIGVVVSLYSGWKLSKIMHYCQIQRNFRDNEYLCKLGKEYLTHCHASFKFFFYIKFAKFWHITRISITNRRKVINFQKQSGFWPTLYMSWTGCPQDAFVSGNELRSMWTTSDMLSHHLRTTNSHFRTWPPFPPNDDVLNISWW